MERAAAQCAAQALLSARCSSGSSPSSNAAGPSASKAGQASHDSINGRSMRAPSQAHHLAPTDSAWQQLCLLLHGFSQPATEQGFLAYKYQQTRTLDALAAAYHAALALTFVVSFPATSWLQLRTLLDLLGVVLGWAVPAAVLAMRRPLLSPRAGRWLSCWWTWCWLCRWVWCGRCSNDAARYLGADCGRAAGRVA